jgi:hypothetical protein
MTNLYIIYFYLKNLHSDESDRLKSQKSKVKSQKKDKFNISFTF